MCAPKIAVQEKQLISILCDEKHLSLMLLKPDIVHKTVHGRVQQLWKLKYGLKKKKSLKLGS